MLTELLMHHMAWTDIWYAHPGPFSVRRFIAHPRLFLKRWHVGVWTGPQNDLICIKYCNTNEEVDRFLSPGATTIGLACVAALGKVWWEDALAGCEPEYVERHEPLTDWQRMIWAVGLGALPWLMMRGSR